MLLSWAIYQRLGQQEHLSGIWGQFLVAVRSPDWGWLLLCLAFMPVNWSLEALKWQIFTNGQVGFRTALKATLAGVTFAIFTPNRIGDYGGRILLVDAQQNWNTAVATLAGNFCQFMVMATGGLLGLSYFGNRFLTEEFPGLSNLIPATFVLMILLWLVPATLPWWSKYMNKLNGISFLRGFVKSFQGLQKVPLTEIARAMALALVRYTVFCFQYFFILQFYGINLSVGTAISGVATIFLIQAGIPLPPVAALLARGQIAILIWSPFETNAISILAATFTLFIINLLIPSFVGLIYIIKTNTIKSLGYENHAD